MDIEVHVTPEKTPKKVTLTVETKRGDLRVSETQLGVCVSLAGCRVPANGADCRLPQKYLSFALPRNFTIRKISARAVKNEVVAHGPISLAPPLQPWPDRIRPSRLAGNGASVGPARRAKSEKSRHLAQLVGIRRFGDVTVACVELNPVRVNRDGDLTLGTKIQIVCELEPDKKPSSKAGDGLSRAQYDRLLALAKAEVINPQDVTLSQRHDALSSSSVEYLILTDKQKWDPAHFIPLGPATGDLAGSFAALADWRSERGLSARIVTVTDIVTNASGYGDFVTGSRDLQHALRKFVSWAHSNWGVAYLLIGGNAQIVPTRLLAIGEGGSPYAPVDYYYASLAPENDWVELQSVDFGQASFDIDITVGRVAVESAVEVDAFVSKTIAYERRIAPDLTPIPSEYLRRMLLASTPWNWDIRQDVLRDSATTSTPRDNKFSYTPGNSHALIKLIEKIDVLFDPLGDHDHNPDVNHYSHVPGDSYSKICLQTSYNGVDKITVESSTGQSHSLPYNDNADASHHGWRFDQGTTTFILAYDSPNQLEPAAYHVHLSKTFREPQNLLRIDAIGDEHPIPYSMNAAVQGFGWCYANSASDLLPPPVPTPWVVVYNALENFTSLNLDHFTWDPTEIEGSMDNLETLRKQLLLERPDWDDVHRLYTDEVDLPAQWRQTPPLSHYNIPRFVTAMNEGQHIVALSGHGNASSCCSANGSDINNSIADSLVNGFYYSIVYHNGCLTSRFTDDSLSNHFVKNPGNGAVAYIGYADVMEIALGHFFLEHFFSGLAATDLLGTAFDSRTALLQQKNNDSPALRRMIVLHSLSGDPALKVSCAASLGLVALFTREATILAQDYGEFSTGFRNNDSPSDQMSWAIEQRDAEVIDELAGRFNEQLIHQYEKSGSGAAAAFFASSVMRLLAFGVLFSPSENEGDPNSLSFSDHYIWAKWFASSDIFPLCSELEARVRETCAYVLTKRDRILEMIYTTESVSLAELGGFADTADNSGDPATFKNIADLQQAAERLIGKNRFKLSTMPPMDAKSFYADTCARLNRYGIALESGGLDTTDHQVLLSWARSVSVSRMADDLAMRVRRMFIKVHLPDAFPPMAEVCIPDASGAFVQTSKLTATVDVGRFFTQEIKVYNLWGGKFSIGSCELSDELKDPEIAVLRICQNDPDEKAVFGHPINLTLDLVINASGDYCGKIALVPAAAGLDRISLDVSLKAQGPAVRVAPASIDFGKDPLPDPSSPYNLMVDQYLFLINNGDAKAYCCVSLEGENPQGVFSVDTGSGGWLDNPVLPGCETAVTIQYHPSAAGKASATVVVESNPGGRPDLKQTAKISLSGEAYCCVPAIEVQPSALSYGVVPSNQEAHLFPMIKNVGTGDLTLSDLQIQMVNKPDFDSDFYLDYMPQTDDATLVVLKPGETHVPDIIFYPVRNGIRYEGRLLVASNDPDTPLVDIPLDGTTLGARMGVSIDARIKFNTVSKGAATQSQTIRVWASGTCPLNVLGIALDPACPAFSLSGGIPSAPFQLQPGKDITFDVLFNANKEGSFSTNLKISSDACASPNRSYMVEGTCS